MHYSFGEFLRRSDNLLFWWIRGFLIHSSGGPVEGIDTPERFWGAPGGGFETASG